MTDELVMNWTLGAPALLAIAAGAILLLLLLIIKWRIHAFVALVVISLLTAVATGIPVGSIVPTLTGGFGGTLASVALLVGLGAMLGRMLETSGGAEVLTNALIGKFGEKRAPLALSVASLLFGFPIFFDAGLVVMLPIIFTVARRLGGSFLGYAFPAATAFSVMHIFVPPHPGPVAASGLLEANVGLVLLLGLVVAIPTWYFVGHLFGKYVGRKYNIAIPDILAGSEKEQHDFASKPSLGTVVTLLLLPLILIFMNTGLNALATAGIVDKNETWVQILRLLGETPIALLITVLLAMYLLGYKQNKDKTLIETGHRFRARPGVLDHPDHRRRRHVRCRAARQRHRRRRRQLAGGRRPADHRRRLHHRRGGPRGTGFGNRRPDHGRSDRPAGCRRQRRLQRGRGRRHRAGAGSGLGVRRPRQRLRLLAGLALLRHGREDHPEGVDRGPGPGRHLRLHHRPGHLRRCRRRSLAQPTESTGESPWVATSLT